MVGEDVELARADLRFPADSVKTFANDDAIFDFSFKNQIRFDLYRGIVFRHL